MILTKKKYPKKAHWRGRKHTEESKKKMRENASRWNKGLKMPLALRMRLSKLKRGDKHPNWKGGISNINQKLRKGIEYRLWRESVFVRDNYTCIWCGSRGVYLEADHIKPFCDYPELRFALDNGRTLCKECHSKTETYKGNMNRGKKYKTKSRDLDPGAINNTIGQA
jgi:5-methylcytosine-specific restriction endonuclease McrA